MGISTVLLAYREEENLRILLPQIHSELQKLGEDYEIIVVDTEKPLDETPAVCAEQGAVYVNQEERGFGGAFRTGIRHATKDTFLILDSDGSHDPRYIPDLYRKFKEGADVVIGSRYVSGGKTNDAKSSVFMSKILNNTFRFFLGIRARDISTDFRMYKTYQLKQIVLSCSNYDILQEVLLKLKINKPRLVIAEVPIEFNKRMYGESKRNLFRFILSYIKTLVHLVGIRLTADRPGEVRR